MAPSLFGWVTEPPLSASHSTTKRWRPVTDSQRMLGLGPRMWGLGSRQAGRGEPQGRFSTGRVAVHRYREGGIAGWAGVAPDAGSLHNAAEREQEGGGAAVHGMMSHVYSAIPPPWRVNPTMRDPRCRLIPACARLHGQLEDLFEVIERVLILS